MKKLQKTPSNILICRKKDYMPWLRCSIYEATWTKLSLNDFVKDAMFFTLKHGDKFTPTYYHFYWDDLTDEDAKLARLVDCFLLRPYYGKFISFNDNESTYRRYICLHNYHSHFRFKLDHDGDSILIRPANQKNGKFVYEPLGEGQRSFLRLQACKSTSL